MINRLRISADSVSDYVLIEPTTGIPANDSYLLIDEAVEGQSVYRIVSNFDVKLDYNTGAGASVQNIPSDIEIRYYIVANPDFNTVIIPPSADRYRLPSQIVGVTKESYNSITYQLPEGVSDFYVSAKLFYVDGNEVFDSNGDPVDFIESLLGSYPIGSLTITKDPSSGTVAGDSVDYTVTPTGIGADLPDLRYSWSVSAASGGTSSTANRTTATPTITFDNDDTYTVTCTVSSVLTGESVVDTDEITVAAAGPTLIIHDAFSGSGDLSGRTPDTVDNGKTWTTHNGETYSISGGVVQASNDFSDYSKSADIDVQTSNYTLKCLVGLTTAAGNSLCGATICVSDATDGSETLVKFDLDSSRRLRCVEYDNGSFVITALSNSLPIGISPLIVLDVDGVSVSWEILNSTETFSYESGSTSFSIAPSNRCGVNVVTDATYGILDFKVYA